MVHITGTTQFAGVIGWPIEHSLSPVMHNAVYEQLGLDWVYLPLPVADEISLHRVVAAIRALPFVGFNVTMPYKAAVVDLCDEVATAARLAGAVNTVHCVDGKLVGYNTDGRGLLESLEDEVGFVPEGKRVALLGAGGAAGAALVGFILGRASGVDVISRDIEKADDLIDRVIGAAKNTDLGAVTFEDAMSAVQNADLIVNATPLGMNDGDPSPIPAGWLREGQVVLDMVYGRPRPTALFADAVAAGARVIDGLGMLVGQGATAVDIWNEDHVERTPRAPMRAAAEAELARRAAGRERE
ncbi:MAG: shikimate dehydrogenase [Coriobacteriia bacterium]|nr:shikimate dehydrogenase [Coriobacteriia bacterium]